MKVLKDMVLTVTTQYPPHSIYFFSQYLFLPTPQNAYGEYSIS